MGSDAIAVPVLKYLAEEASHRVSVAGVFSQPDRPKGRGKHLQPNPLAAAALSRRTLPAAAAALGLMVSLVLPEVAPISGGGGGV